MGSRARGGAGCGSHRCKPNDDHDEHEFHDEYVDDHRDVVEYVSNVDLLFDLSVDQHFNEHLHEFIQQFVDVEYDVERNIGAVERDRFVGKW